MDRQTGRQTVQKSQSVLHIISALCKRVVRLFSSAVSIALHAIFKLAVSLAKFGCFPGESIHYKAYDSLARHSLIG